MADRIQVRRDTAADWTSNDPTLAAGEIGFVSDSNELVVGDGSTAFTSLERVPVSNEVQAIGSSLTASTMSTSETTKLTYTLTVPSAWSTYDLYGAAGLRFVDNGGAAGIATLTCRMKVGGTTVGELIEKVDTTAPDDTKSMTITSVGSGFSSTGSVSITVTTQLSAESGNFDVDRVRSWIVAVRQT